MKHSQFIKQAAALAAVISLAACGGGGSDDSSTANGNGSSNTGGSGNTGSGGNAGAASFSNRVTRVDYDYDKNGVIDATDAISYDANGRVNLTTYIYTDDGTPDILNLRDSGITQETNSFAYDSAGNVTLFVVDRLFQRIEAESSYDTDGLLARVDFRILDGSGGQIISLFWAQSYTGQQLDSVDNFINSSNQLADKLSFDYNTDGLLVAADFTSSAFNATTSFNWRPDGQLAALDTQNDNGASSSVTLSYDAQGLQQEQRWLNTGQGFSYSEVPDRNYTRSIAYDAQNRPFTLSYDQDSDGGVDATVTLTWESGACIPATLWAPNGFPNFVRDPTRPIAPGTGFFTTELCAP